MHRRLTDLAHEFIAAILKPGMTAIDATAGNGHDTLFLGSCVGVEGRVIAFDVQEQAIEETRQRLEQFQFCNVTLKQCSHELLTQVCETLNVTKVDAIMFNLGYLPGGDRDLTTLSQTSIIAIEQALKLLTPCGLLTVMTYPGHPEGEREHEAVKAFFETLDPAQWTVQIHLPISNSPQSKGPRLFVIGRVNN